MFVIFNNISGEPLIVKISSDHTLKGDIAEKAIMLLSSYEAGVAALKKIFGSDEEWNLSRFSLQESTDPIRTFCALKEKTKVDLFCDESGKLLSEKEIWPLIGLKENG